ncbi:MAG: PadR family transcriptional regulator [Longimicrobiales bacterium]
MPSEASLLQGTLDMLVLKSLIWGARHGYGVARWIGGTTDGVLRIEEGALYTALHRLERRGYVVSEWGASENNRRAKYYELTEDGRSELRAGERAWTRYAEAVFRVLRAKEAAS